MAIPSSMRNLIPKTKAKKKFEIPVDLKDCLDYRPETGELFWLERPREHFTTDQSWRWWNSRFAGKPTGTDTKNDKRQISFQGKRYEVCRLVWEMHHRVKLGPTDVITYADGKRSNIAIKNLVLTAQSVEGA